MNMQYVITYYIQQQSEMEEWPEVIRVNVLY